MRRLAAALALLAPAAAQATDIAAHAFVQFDHGQVVALVMGWQFDKDSTREQLLRFDQDGDQRLSAGEVRRMEEDALRGPAQAGYFTHAFVGDQRVAWTAAEGLRVLAFEQSLVYRFALPLPQPVDPRRQRFRFSTYGDAHHVHIAFPSPSAIKLIGDGAEGCRAVMGPDLENRLYGGVVVPTKVDIVCE